MAREEVHREKQSGRSMRVGKWHESTEKEHKRDGSFSNKVYRNGCSKRGTNI